MGPGNKLDLFVLGLIKLAITVGPFSYFTCFRAFWNKGIDTRTRTAVAISSRADCEQITFKLKMLSLTLKFAHFLMYIIRYVG